MVSGRFCNKETRSLTPWRQKMVTKVSAAGLARSLTSWGQDMVIKGSAASFAEKRSDHLQTEGGRWWPPKDQWQFCSKETRSLTAWGQWIDTKGSAAGFAAKRTDHLPPEGRRWQWKGQQQVLQQRDQITYSLKAGDGQQQVLQKKIRSLTHWGQEMARKWSAGFGSKKPSPLHPEVKRWPPRVSSRFCSKENRSLTSWGHDMAIKGSAAETRSLTSWSQERATKGSAAGFKIQRPDHLLSEMATKRLEAGFANKKTERQDHLPTEGRKWPPKGHQQVLQKRDQITYKLRVGDEGHQRVSNRFWSQ